MPRSASDPFAAAGRFLPEGRLFRSLETMTSIGLLTLTVSLPAALPSVGATQAERVGVLVLQVVVLGVVLRSLSERGPGKGGLAASKVPLLDGLSIAAAVLTILVTSAGRLQAITIGWPLTCAAIVLLDVALAGALIALLGTRRRPEATPGRGLVMLTVGALLAAVFQRSIDPLALVAAMIVLGALLLRLHWADEINDGLWREQNAQATQDSLTGLANRSHFLHEVDRLASQQQVVVLYIDLVGFREINDVFGQAQGDAVLVTVAQHLEYLTGAAGFAARIGGDEFAVCLPGEQLDRAQELGGVLNRRLLGDPAAHAATARTGLATGSRVRAERLLQDADLAMFAARRAESDSAVPFEPWMRARSRDRVAIEFGLMETLLLPDSDHEGGPLQLEFAPIVALRDGSVWGFEATPCWNDGQNPSSPTDFLTIAAEVGLINDVGWWTLLQALRWRAANGHGVISVPAAPSQIIEPEITSRILAALETARLTPQDLVLDVPSTIDPAVLNGADRSLRELREAGVRIALDNFGAGPLFLASLAELPIDLIKIAPMFVEDLEEPGRPPTLLRTAVQLTGDLAISLVGKGVRSPRQKQVLDELGYTYAQGSLFTTGPLRTA